MTGLPETGVKLVADNASGFLSSLSRASGGVNAFENNTRNASTSSIALGVTLGNLAAGALTQIVSLATRAGTALAGFVGDSINMAGALEAQMSGVSAVMGTTAEELDALKQLTIDLGLDPNLRVSTLEAAEAMEVLAQAGIDYTQITEGALRETVFLANATGADFATAAGIAVSGMSLFNIEAANMRDVVDGTSAVINSSVFDVNDFALALTNGGAVANSMGISFDEFATTIAAISPQFSSGQTAGTAFKNLLLRLVPSTEKAEDAMKELGLITEDGANAFHNADGSLKSMAEVAGILETTLAGLSVQQQTTALKTIFGNDAMGAAIALAQIGEGEFSALADSMAQVDSGAAAATRVANFAGAMDIASGAVEAIKLQIGAEFLPVLTQLAGKFSEFVDQNGQKFIDFFKTAATFFEDLVSAFLEGQGPIDAFTGALESIGADTSVLQTIRRIADSIGDFISFLADNKSTIINVLGAIVAGLAVFGGLSGIVSIVGGIATAVATLTAVFAATGTVFGTIVAVLGGPVTLAIAGIALAVGLFSLAWSENWLGIRDILTEVWEGKLKPVLDIMGQALGLVLTVAIQRLSDFWTNTLVPAMTSAWEFIQSRINPILNQVSFILGMVITQAIQKASDFWTNTLVPALTAAWSFIQESVVPAISNMVAWIGEKMTAAIQIASDFWTNTLLPAITSIWSFIQESILPAFQNLFVELGENQTGVIQILSDFWTNTLLPALSNVWDFIKNSVFPLFVAIAEFISAVFGKAVTALAGLWQNILLPAFKDVWKFVTEKLQPVFEFVSNFIKDAFIASVKGLVDFVNDFLVPALITAGDTVQSLFGAAFELVRNTIIDPFKATLEGLGDTLGRIKVLFENFTNAVKNFELPDILTPGSPTPMEIGLRGIADAAHHAGIMLEQFGRRGKVAGQAVNTIAILPETAAMDEQLATIESRIQSISSGAAGLSGMEALQAIRALTFQRDQLSTPQQQSQQTAINNNNTTNNNQQQTNNFNIPGVGIPSLLEQLMAQMA